MVDYTGEVLREGRSGERGATLPALGKFTLTAGLGDADTITIPSLIPASSTCKVVGFKFWGLELDTNATPTGLMTIGDGTDADGYLTTKNLGKPAQAPANGSQLVYFGDGALIGADSGTAAGRDVVITITAALATAVTSGNVFVEVLVEAV